jgi:hypothetical protein
VSTCSWSWNALGHSFSGWLINQEVCYWWKCGSISKYDAMPGYPMGHWTEPLPDDWEWFYLLCEEQVYQWHGIFWCYFLKSVLILIGQWWILKWIVWPRITVMIWLVSGLVKYSSLKERHGLSSLEIKKSFMRQVRPFMIISIVKQCFSNWKGLVGCQSMPAIMSTGRPAK